MKEILITSSVLILAIILLRLLFRNKVSRRLIYGAWLLVALRLLIPVQFGNLNFSVLTPAKPVTNIITDIAQRPVSGPDREQVYSSVLQDYLSQGGPVFIPEVQEQVEAQIQHGRPEQEVYDELLESNKPESILLPEINREIESKVSETVTPTVGQIATVIWIAGMVAMAVWFVAVNLSFHRKLRASAKAFDLPESEVSVKVSSVLTSPCLFGLWRPTIYMTPGCVDNEQTRRHVLTHELTHMRHGDHIWSWVRCICLCIYWFNPLVWVAASLSRRDCELACDEAVLKKLGEGERLAYGKTLLDMVSSVPAPGQLLETATAMHETKKQLKERMKCIVKKPKVFLTAAIILLVVLTVITGCTFSGAFDGSTGTIPDDPNPDNTQPSTVPSATTTTQPTTAPTASTTMPSTIPNTTTPSTPTTPADDPELAFFHEMFHGISMSDRETRNYYNYALGQEYASPTELDLRNFFGNGFKGEKTVTQAELAELKPYLENSFWGYPAAGDFHRLPKDKMEEELQKCFDISLADLPESAFARLIYLESTDCYCFYATGMQGMAERFEAKAVEHQNDGTVKVIYSKTAYPKWDFVVTLQPTDNGYQILSNTYLPGTTEDPEVLRYVDNAFLKVESFASDPAKALSMEFHDDNRISVRYALESTGRKGTLILKPQGVSLVIISNTLDS